MGSVQFYKKQFPVEKYNEYMNGVDMADQLLEPCEPNRKSLAWFKKLGLHLIMRVILNSYLVYKNVANNKIDIQKYIQKLVQELLEAHSVGEKNVFKKYIADNPRAGRKRKREEVVHALVPLPQAPGSSVSRPKKRCRVCYPQRKQTRMCCIGCPEAPGLCSLDNFKIFHENKDD